MPIKRGPDGHMIEDPTIGPGEVPKLDPQAGGVDKEALRSRYDQPTHMPGAGGNAATSSSVNREALDPPTQIMGRARSDSDVTSSAMDDPAVGWLVVVKGPGIGNVLTLGYGRNTVGRGEDARQKVDFGDSEVSRGAHCVVYYEPRDREFSVQHGEGVNMTYLNGDPLYEREALTSGSIIELGTTALRFIPFCSKDWDWKSETSDT